MKELEVLLFLPGLDPMQHERRVSYQNVSLTYLVVGVEVAAAGDLPGKNRLAAGKSWPNRGCNNPDVRWILCEP